MTILRWPLRFGCLAIVLVDAEPEDPPAIESRQAHLFGCPCARCVAIVAPPAIAAGVEVEVAHGS